MAFTEPVFAAFFAVVFTAYWAIRERRAQNLLLLVGSYVFYGWVDPRFCALIAGSTLVDYVCGRAIASTNGGRRRWLVASLAFNLGLLATFKYFGFFAESFGAAAAAVGLPLELPELAVILPVGISFYTFQTLSYTIDIYRGELEPRKSLVDFALFVAFFPQLVAGPIERAKRFLPQLEAPRRFDAAALFPAAQLIVGGYLKKLVVADNVALYVDQVFGLQSPSLALLAVGSLGFAIQIYADFSAYTDIARGVAKLLGFDLVVNFKSPYLAHSPSDFWRRWHISFSSWIRDYLYIPLGGSRVSGKARFLLILVATLGLSGLWHGAAWNFVAWGVYHALLVWAYHALGMGGRWKPSNAAVRTLSWAAMFCFTLFGWLIFRTQDMGWLAAALGSGHIGLGGDHGVAATYVLSLVLLYGSPMLLQGFVERLGSNRVVLRSAFLAGAVAAILIYARGEGVDFIYFRF